MNHNGDHVIVYMRKVFLEDVMNKPYKEKAQVFFFQSKITFNVKKRKKKLHVNIWKLFFVWLYIYKQSDSIIQEIQH